MSKKELVKDLLAQVRAEEIKFTDSLTSDELSAAGAADAWSAKDELAHVAEWKSISARRMDRCHLGEAIEVFEDFNEKNNEIFQQYQDAGWSEIRALLAQSSEKLEESLSQMSEDDLTDGNKFEWTDGQPLWMRVVATNVTHSYWHLADLYRNRGDNAHANEVLLVFTEKLVNLDDDPRWRGTQTYNLGCFSALNGDRDTAVAYLKEAFPQRPDLKEFAKEDSDLDSLREDPEFQALLKAEG